MTNQNLEGLVKDYEQANMLNENFKKDPSNPDLREGATNYIRNYFAKTASEDPDNKKLQELAAGAQSVDLVSARDDVSRKFLNATYSNTRKTLADYVGKNYASILNSLDEKSAAKLAINIPPVKDTKYSGLAELHEAYLKAVTNLQAASQGDEQAMQNIEKDVNSLLKGDALGEAIAYAIRADPQLRFKFYNGVAAVREAMFMNELKGKEKDYLTANIEKADPKIKDTIYTEMAKYAVSKKK